MVAIFVSVGSNIAREDNIRSGVRVLRQHFPDLNCSSVYESDAEGFDGDPFYNLVVAFQGEGLANINKILRLIEEQHGRTRQAQKFCPRTLDLDLLLFGDQVLIDKGWDVPRAEITQYAFILWPLAEIAPELSHPILGLKMKQLWSQYCLKNPSTVNQIKAIEFKFD